ncbi:hypothetical protein ACHAXS_004344 [Conticribra weissflogii]
MFIRLAVVISSFSMTLAMPRCQINAAFISTYQPKKIFFSSRYQNLDYNFYHRPAISTENRFRLIARTGLNKNDDHSIIHADTSDAVNSYDTSLQREQDLENTHLATYDFILIGIRQLIQLASFFMGMTVGALVLIAIITSRVILPQRIQMYKEHAANNDNDVVSNLSNAEGGSRTALLALYGRSQAHKMQLAGASDYLATELMKNLSIFGTTIKGESDSAFEVGRFLTNLCSELSVLNHRITSQISKFLADFQTGGITQELTCGSIFEDQVALIATLGNTGLVAAMHVRTSWLDEKVDSFVNENQNNQANVVILGSGYDTRPYRMKCLQSESIKVYEVDAPGTQNEKKSAIQKLQQRGIISDTVSKFVPCDFSSQNWMECLIDEGFDQSLPTFVIWEGVSMYLTLPMIQSTLKIIANRGGNTLDSKNANCSHSLSANWYIAFDYLNPTWAFSPIWKFVTRRAREPLQSAFTAAETEDLIKSVGLAVLENISEGREMHKRYATTEAGGKISYEIPVQYIGHYGGFVLAGSKQN